MPVRFHVASVTFYPPQQRRRGLSRTLIEGQGKGLFRVVERECTWHGYDAKSWYIVAQNLPDIPAAKKAVIFAKQGRLDNG